MPTVIYERCARRLYRARSIPGRILEFEASVVAVLHRIIERLNTEWITVYESPLLVVQIGAREAPERPQLLKYKGVFTGWKK